jgi:tRNA-dihydrouridine synthase B
MAGMTDTAFRRLVKRQGGCGLVVTEMVSSEGLVRGIDRTLEYAEYTEEERPIALQIFGGNPHTMAEAARIVEGMGADVVDINMGCPVKKIAKHNAGCSLMREPEHAARIVSAMTTAVSIPVTVKMRAGWNDGERNAPILARMVQDAGAAAVTIHGRTAEQSYNGLADWDLVSRVAADLKIPVLGSGDCLEPEQIVSRLQAGVAGVLVGRGVLRNPWILAQSADIRAGRVPRTVTMEDRGRFLLEYIDLLLDEQENEAKGFRHTAPGRLSDLAPAAGRERWVINKLRALCAWYSKGLDAGSHLRIRVNRVDQVAELRRTIEEFFLANTSVAPA